MVLTVVLAFLGCKTPNRYTPPPDGGVVQEEVDSSPPSSDTGADRPDTSTAADAAADSGTSLPLDTAPPTADVLPADLAVPCSNGIARCSASGTAVELCTNGQWTVKENCPLTCSGAACTAVCTAGVSCTMGIGPCRKGATFCATPTSQPVCNEAGIDDTRGGCTGGNVCKGGDCVAACKSGVACSDGIGPCRKGTTSCASPTSQPTCQDVGADDSKGGCTGGQICSGGKCAVNPCAGQSMGNLVPNAGFDSSVWPRLSNNTFGLGSWNSSDANNCPNSGSLQIANDDAPSICIGFGTATKLYAGYMVNRSTSDGQLGCFVDAWYTDTTCQNAWDYGNEEGLIAPNLTGWQQVSTTITPPPTTKSMVLQCHHSDMNTAPFMVDRFYLRTTPGGF